MAIISGGLAFAFSLLFKPVRDFLFSETVPYPIYCTAEVYSSSADWTSTRTEFLLVNVTDRRLSRADLEGELAVEGAGASGPSPDITLVYTRGIGEVADVSGDVSFNEGKGELSVSKVGNNVVVKPQYFEPRAVMRVLIDITGWDPVPVTRAARNAVPFRIEAYERGCYSR